MGKRATTSDSKIPESGPLLFPIVGIGASAGGLDAFRELLTHLPSDTGMGFVLTQHLDPDHKSALVQILASVASMPVHEVKDGLRVAPNQIYIIPPNCEMTIAHGVLKLQRRQAQRIPNHSIDLFFQSLAEDCRERAIGVILSGAASDGTLGMEAIKAEGGLTFAQDESARYDSMPRSAIAAGCVDFVLTPENIAKELARIAGHPYVASPSLAPIPLQKERGEKLSGFPTILRLLRELSGVDFSLYKVNTVHRRIARRMMLKNTDSLKTYASFLRENPKELTALYSDLLINVTRFFRNPSAFEVLKGKVFPRFAQLPRDKPLRIWAPGCSTGQEAFSIAMSAVEFFEQTGRSHRLQLFATDVSDAVLDKARSGLYAKSLVQDVSPERLHRFFVEDNGDYRVAKFLREAIVFARHNVLTDPAFSQMDMISCRNLLIYLEADLQQKILPTFHYALKPGGFLFLGESESIGALSNLFETVDKKHKIFSKKPGLTAQLHFATRQLPKKERSSAKLSPFPEGLPTRADAQREADRITLNRFAPPSVLIDGQLQILQFRGDTGLFLKPSTGKATFQVLKMAREGLLAPLRSAIRKAKEENKTVRREGVRVAQNGGSGSVNLEVVPLTHLKERCCLIFFEDAKKPPPLAAVATAVEEPRKGRRLDSRRVAELERELAENRDYAQSLQDQHEAANEELQASNEEVTSANEELQSINEELETSKEELESANEELTTVNEEMANRNTELNRSNADLNNLHASLKMAILLLTRELIIRSFTPLAGKLFNLLNGDVGRPIRNVRHNLDISDFEPMLQEAIDTISERDREVQDKDGRWYSLRVHPYLTLDNKIDGVVLVMMDIDALKRSQQEIAAARDYAQAILRTTRYPFLVLTEELCVQTANDAFFKTFKLSPDETIGRLVYQIDNGQWDFPELRNLLEDILPRNRFFDDVEVAHHFEGLGLRALLLSARRLNTDEPDAPIRILLAIDDITDSKQLAREQAARADSEAANRAKDDFLATVSHELRTPLSPILGWSLLLRKQKPDEATYVRAVESIERNAKVQAQLIEDILDVSRVITGKLRLDFRPIDPAAVIDAAIDNVRSTADAASIRIETHYEPEVGRIPGDPGRLQQVLGNLLSNAVKFTPGGGRIDVYLEKGDSEVQITVKDTGKGIRADFLPSIFQRFRQADSTSTRKFGGLGLGLAIVREIVEMHGGAVSVQSPGEGQGSTFTVTLPSVDLRNKEDTVPGEGRLTPRNVPAAPFVCPPQIYGLRVLLVDDQPDTLEMLRTALENECGAEVRTSTSAAAAFEEFRQWKPDVLVSDIAMPDEDGYTLIAKVRSLEELSHSRTPAIALTAYVRVEDRVHAIRAGYDMFVPKPVEPSELLATLAGLVGAVPGKT